MQIITIENEDFPELLAAWKESILIGKFWKNGSQKTVCVTRQFVFVSPSECPTKLAMKPARSLDDAQNIARHILAREKQRGNKVEILLSESERA